MKTFSIATTLGLAALALLVAGVPSASSQTCLPDPVFCTDDDEAGALGVCVISVGCVAYCPTGGFETCGPSFCYRFVRQADVVQVCTTLV